MANLSYQILPSPDAEIFDAFEAVWREFGESAQASFAVTILDNGGRSINGPMTSFRNEQVAWLADSRLIVLKQITMSVPDYHGFNLAVTRQNQSPLTDTLSASIQDNLDVGVSTRATLTVRGAFRR